MARTEEKMAEGGAIGELKGREMSAVKNDYVS
jgi:hypothetical protein